MQANTHEDCLTNVMATFQIFMKHGFIIHPNKSAFVPSRQIKMLGLILYSVNMNFTPTQIKPTGLLLYVVQY